MLTQVLSGGQTGVDQGALRAARACGIATGGYAPKGWLTEDGPAPWLADYGLAEHASPDYPARTLANVESADFTLILCDGERMGRGTSLTLTLCRRLRKPHRVVPLGVRDAEEVAEVVRTLRRAVRPFALNVAGPRESKAPGVGVRAEAYLVEAFRLLKEPS